MAREVLDICLKIIMCKHQLDLMKTVGGINFLSSESAKNACFSNLP